MVALRWRGSWMAAALRLFGLLSLSLPFSLFRFCFSFSFLFLFSVLVSVFSSLSPLRALSLSSVSSLSLCFSKKNPLLLSPSVSPFIEKKHGAGMLFVRAFNHATAGRPLGRVWWRWGEERERERRGIFFKNFVFCSVKTGGRRKMNSVVQNDLKLFLYSNPLESHLAIPFNKN